MPDSEAASARTRDEIADGIRGLSVADRVRLLSSAKALARNKPIEAEDLLQEAFRRALDGGRVCPGHVDVLRFLRETMRSIADGELDKIKRRPALVPIDNHGGGNGEVDPPDLAPDVVRHLADRQALTAVLALFDDDPVAQVVVEGIMEGIEGEELRALTDLDATAYQSKRKMIRRRIDKRFPKGWTAL